MYIDVMRAAIAATERGEAGVLCTVLDHHGSAPGKRHHKMLVLGSGAVHGTVGGGSLEATVLDRAREVLRDATPTIETFKMLPKAQGGTGAVCGGTLRVVFEVLPRPPRILICGAGHVGLEIARTLAQLGYPNEVHDDRAALAQEARFPSTTTTLVGAPEELVADIGGLARFSHVILVSRGHDTDRAYGCAVLKSGYEGWIGMMGSRRKHVVVAKAWLEEDGLTQPAIDRIECPVGVGIGGSTPAEIAISIVARIIQTST